jgi:hypothetical protein
MLDIIKHICFNKNGTIHAHVNRHAWWESKSLGEIKTWILCNTSYLSDDTKMSVRIHHVLAGIQSKPLCERDMCEKFTKWNVDLRKYNTYCSPRCASINTREQASRTCFNNHGVSNPLNIATVREKMLSTIELRKDVIRNKKIKTCLKNHGVKYPQQSKSVREKTIKTLNEKYGVDNATTIFTQSHISNEKLKLLNDVTWLKQINNSHSLEEIADIVGVTRTTVSNRFRSNGISPKRFAFTKFEKEVSCFVEKFVEIDRNLKSIIPPLELDIYIPSLSISIECNGSFWHSEVGHNKFCNEKSPRDKNYHLNKTNLCEEKGINLIHIWEHDWNKNKNLVKGRLLNKLGKSPRVYARNTTICNITRGDASSFLDNHHLQGTCPSSVRYGLYDGDELVAVMTFGKSRFSKKYEWELLRYCSSKQVIGGASKLFKHFQREHKPKSVVSYSDKMWNTGTMYRALGFEYSHSSAPSYYYTKNYVDFENRVAYQKHKLEKKLEHFDSNLTEWENMKANGYDRIWDCGNDVWTFSM